MKQPAHLTPSPGPHESAPENPNAPVFPVEPDEEWPIKEVARASGLTSRTLRHYEQIGLLAPGRVATNGYRFYCRPQISRLYRIMSLRSLGLPLEEIKALLADDQSVAEVVRAHLTQLEDAQDHLVHQIAVVRQTLTALESRNTMTIDQIFANFDHTQHEREVRERWGESAWKRSADRRAHLSDEELRADGQCSLDVNRALREAAEAGLDPQSDAFQALVSEHYEWVTLQWGNVKPDPTAYAGLAEMYVADDRFAATYGGRERAEVIRDAIRIWIASHLSSAL